MRLLKSSPLRLSVFASLLLLAVFFIPNKASAATYIEVFPDIDSSGYVTAGTSGVCNAGSTIFGYRDYSGEYPAGSNMFDVAANTNCSAIFGAFSSSMEAGWLNGSGSTPDGFYWTAITFAGSAFSPDWTGNIYYWRALRAGGQWYNLSDEDTRYLALSYPTEGQNIATTTGGQIHTAPVGYSLSIWNGNLPVTNVSLRFTNTDFIADYTVYATTTGLGLNTFVGTTTLPAGNYQTSVVLSNTDEGYGYASSNLRAFSVGSQGYINLVLGTDPNDPTNLLGLATSTCSISNITGCFQNALVMLFWPSASSTERILSIGTLISKKPPIGYFYAIADQINDVSGSSTPTMVITIPDGIIDMFFNPLNIAITGILWWFFAVHFWHRLKNLHIV